MASHSKINCLSHIIGTSYDELTLEIIREATIQIVPIVRVLLLAIYLGLLLPFQSQNYLHSLEHFKNQKSLGQKSLWIFVPGSKPDKRWEQKQHYASLRSQQLLRCFLDMRLVTVQPSKELQL